MDANDPVLSVGVVEFSASCLAARNIEHSVLSGIEMTTLAR